MTASEEQIMTRADPLTFFESVYAAYQHAEHTIGGIDRYYKLGAYTIRLRFAGPALVPLITSAFEHLTTNAVASPALTVCLWDSPSTSEALPPSSSSFDSYYARGELRGFKTGRFRAAFELGGNILNLFDTERNLALYRIRDASQNLFHQYSSPLIRILPWWARTRGYQYLHAGAIGTSTGGVLLVGKGGSGKSTTSLACINSKLMYAGDDYCLLATEPTPYVYSLYNSGKLETNHILKFPHLTPAISHIESFGIEKAIVFLQQHYPYKIASGFPIRAVLMPQITGRPNTYLTPSSPSAALRALAPSTLLQLLGTGPSDLEMIADLVKRVSCYVLELGTDLEKIPQVISSLLEDG